MKIRVGNSIRIMALRAPDYSTIVPRTSGYVNRSVERCLACEADAVGAVESALLTGRNNPDIERRQDLRMRHNVPLLTTASQARQRSKAAHPSSTSTRIYFAPTVPQYNETVSQVSLLAG